MANRDRYDLIHCILSHLSDGEPKNNVRIMYACHLSNVQSHTVIDEMLEWGLIIKRDIINQRSQNYAITGKGMELLQILDELHNMTKNGLELVRL